MKRNCRLHRNTMDVVNKNGLVIGKVYFEKTADKLHITGAHGTFTHNGTTITTPSFPNKGCDCIKEVMNFINNELSK